MSNTAPGRILWRDEFSVGIADIDDQHQRLLGLLNKLNSLNHQQTSPRIYDLLTLLESLNEYAATHFLSEETLMREHLANDESTVNHIVAHRSYWVIISTLKKRFQAGDAKVNGELVEYLNRWWINHILQTDQHMGRELNRRGIH